MCGGCSSGRLPYGQSFQRDTAVKRVLSVFTHVMLLAVKHAIVCTSDLLSGAIDADVRLPDTMIAVPLPCLPLIVYRADIRADRHLSHTLVRCHD